MLYLLRWYLKLLSRLILKKYRPEIIAISGSIGKTSAKEAIFLVLSTRLSVRASLKNYNNELGVPLTIIGAVSPAKSLSGWLKILIKSLKLFVFRDPTYPKILVLEMGIDRPGDMKYLVDLAPPTIGVITAVSYAHLDYFGTLQKIKKEKQVLIENVSLKGLSVLNYDNEAARSMAEVSPARVLTYGFKIGADLLAQDVNYKFQQGNYEISGVNFKLNYEGSIVPVNMPNILGEGGIYAALAAASVALHLGFHLMEIAESLRSLRLPAGRMQLLAGIKHTFLIDDSYNSSPEACLSALNVLGQIKVDKQAYKYAVLGDMLEIGNYKEEAHYNIGREIFAQGIDFLVSVGVNSLIIDRGAKEAGMMADHIFHFETAEEAGIFVRENLFEGDVVLIKGSQAIRLEKVTKKLLAEPEKASKLLIRQEESWQ
jgi:UDP-N-acetylmuramoyl-tripeptide--D-alanyl-D-alanine ligase